MYQRSASPPLPLRRFGASARVETTDIAGDVRESRITRRRSLIKQKLGLGDYEGRGWRGFHHATLCIAAYGFLIVSDGLTARFGQRPQGR